MEFIINIKIQLLISYILLLICIYAIIYRINFRSEENERKSYNEVNTIILEDKYIENTDVYDSLLKNFNCQREDYYYSFIELDAYEYPILLLSDGVYKYINGRNVAMWTDIYYPVNNEVTMIGNISSNGTAYPIAANTTGIYTAGGHEVSKYGLDIQNMKLKLVSKYIMYFHKVGEKVNAITVEIIDDKNKIVSEEDFSKAYESYGNANIIYFKRLC